MKNRDKGEEDYIEPQKTTMMVDIQEEKVIMAEDRCQTLDYRMRCLRRDVNGIPG